ncbi:quinolinate synthetase complex, A subunit [Ammonifex degensii KC4]|uniref:Quinolinate synthase n=1 Tax=Ammonifex degensii (strain DSM 10501 / KC4) TaxID=429009 RepID=C9RBF0_AMMDK|nr:quinolinate synthase NadA [Ammonifex degensii]ACX51577.1 quinolinate synthetase complex, A subunit [Ammonifex degensii KC4]
MEINELKERIAALKAEKNAVILAHNYQRAEVQDVADFVGDSLELSQQAAKTNAEVIVFCGVHFMAETAAIICPEKKVLLPDLAAGCRMADMVTPEDLEAVKQQFPQALVVCYVNSSAAVKAVSDVCCTSANAVRVVEALGDQEILFIPDQYLGEYVREVTGKQVILWPGFCPTHVAIRREEILKLKALYPDAPVVVHPECPREVRELADAVLSTGGICRYAREKDFETLIVGTEVGILHRLRKENPGKRFIPASKKAVCPNMKRITLEKIVRALETLQPEVIVPEEIRLKAHRALERMFVLTGRDTSKTPDSLPSSPNAPVSGA